MSGQLEFNWFEESPPEPPASAPSDPQLVSLQRAALFQTLQQKSESPVDLTITNNRSTMMSVRPSGGRLKVRLHRMFLDAPPRVREAVAAWARNPKAKAAGRVVDAFIRDQRHKLDLPASKPAHVQSRGNFHDLREIYADVNAAEFQNSVDAPITWGKFTARGRRRSIRLGSYSPDQHLIRVHPLLDQEFVPRWFVRYIVFHEMLHADLGIQRSPTGRRRIHHRGFVEREQAYPDYERALRWLDDPRNLARLLRGRK